MQAETRAAEGRVRRLSVTEDECQKLNGYNARVVPSLNFTNQDRDQPVLWATRCLMRRVRGERNLNGRRRTDVSSTKTWVCFEGTLPWIGGCKILKAP